MKRDEMRAIVQAELAGIPRGDTSQNLYRAAFEQWRLNSLGKRPEIPPTSTAAHAKALSAVRQGDPGFVPVLCRQ